MSAFADLPPRSRTADPAASLLAAYAEVDTSASIIIVNAGISTGDVVAGHPGRARAITTVDRSIVAVRSAQAALSRAGRNADDAHGAATSRGLRADVVAIRIPREKLSLLQMLRDAFDSLPIGGRCYIAGANNEGAKTAARLMHELFGNSDVLRTESSHRVVVASKNAASPVDESSFTDVLPAPDSFFVCDVSLRGEPLRLCTRPGVFSWEHLDEATAVLADVMRIAPDAHVLDIGCGAGPLGVAAARLTSGRVIMLDADIEAVRCAECTASVNHVANATARWSDVTDALDGESFDVVVTNPPFHSGKATDLELPSRFITGAHAALAPGGTMYLVANRTLPYERIVTAAFGECETAFENGRFNVLTATRQP
jgi:16S rRNA (guanine1207-N2)-methyltransferase